MTPVVSPRVKYLDIDLLLAFPEDITHFSEADAPDDFTHLSLHLLRREADMIRAYSNTDLSSQPCLASLQLHFLPLPHSEFLSLFLPGG